MWALVVLIGKHKGIVGELHFSFVVDWIDQYMIEHHDQYCHFALGIAIKPITYYRLIIIFFNFQRQWNVYNLCFEMYRFHHHRFPLGKSRTFLLVDEHHNAFYILVSILFLPLSPLLFSLSTSLLFSAGFDRALFYQSVCGLNKVIFTYLAQCNANQSTSFGWGVSHQRTKTTRKRSLYFCACPI